MGRLSLMDQLSPYTAISPIDGRYRGQTKELANYFSEFGLMKFRVLIEIEWLKYQVKIGIAPIKSLSEKSLNFLNSLKALSIQGLMEIKEYEETTKHDVKAIEYYLKDKLKNSNIKEVERLTEFVHFLTTSEDINSPAYALMIKSAVEKIIRPELTKTITKLISIALKFAEIPLLSLTHGQPASPTTFGKEIAIYVSRLSYQLENHFDKMKYYGKFGGATGNYNAHVAIYPNLDWPLLCRNFIEDLGLNYSSYTTQSDSYDYISLICDTMSRIDSIVYDLSVDLWLYMMRHVATLKTESGEVGSSTMPHKINPIKFENCEGNADLAVTIFQFLSRKLPRSRLQRDLSGSTRIRNVGVAFAYTLISLKSLNCGLEKINLDIKQTEKELNDNWSVLSEPFQLISKIYGLDLPFEKIQHLLMGKNIQKSDIINIIREVSQGDEEIEHKLSELAPNTYVGYAPELAKKVIEVYNIK